MALVAVKDLLQYTHDMTDHEDRYSKRRRFTYVNRIQNTVLDVYSNVGNYLDMKVDKSVKSDMLLSIRMDLNSLVGLIEISLHKGFIDARQCAIWTEKVEVLREKLKI